MVGSSPTSGSMKKCKVEGCFEDHSARGLCGKHYDSFRRSKDWFLLEKQIDGRFCEIKGCYKKHKALGMCIQHYYKKYNSLHPNRNKKVNPIDWEKIKNTPVEMPPVLPVDGGEYAVFPVDKT